MLMFDNDESLLWTDSSFNFAFQHLQNHSNAESNVFSVKIYSVNLNVMFEICLSTYFDEVTMDERV